MQTILFPAAILMETEVYMNAIEAYNVFSARGQEFMDSSTDRLPIVECEDDIVSRSF